MKKSPMKKILLALVGIPATLFGFMLVFAFVSGFLETVDDQTTTDWRQEIPEGETSPSGSQNSQGEELVEVAGKQNTVSVSGDFQPINYDNSQTFTNDDVDWVIYWYLCGSDLESDYGAATDDLSEMLSVTLPSNVQVLIQTGGAKQWQNDVVEEDKIQRYLYDSSGLSLVHESANANMGEAETLADFLIFAKENYPAKNAMFNFWNHGGGSISGVAFDENYGDDSLTLPEIYHAFTSVYEENHDDPPFAIIGFDACLMATLDTAYIFSNLAEYMVASEDLEPGIGWNYGFIEDLADNPQLSPSQLGIAICDNYYEDCVRYQIEDEVTLSVVNLAQIPYLLTVFEQYGLEGLIQASSNSGFFTQFAQSATASENYGGNNRREGYTNMVDLGDLARQTSEILPQNSHILAEAIDHCVEYNVKGPMRSDSYGLATYYYYDGDDSNFNVYTAFAPSQAVEYLFDYGLSGELSAEGLAYLNDSLGGLGPDTSEPLPKIEAPQKFTTTALQYEDATVTVDSNANAVMTLGPEAYDVLSTVGFELFYIDYYTDSLLCLGYDNDLYVDWETCTFTDNFRGVWGSLDGYFCYMELSYEGDTYNTYAIPILLNGE
ncbi:MAG: clostripain-related cysteine peptidase, partial [Eubacteriales bacterium]